MIPFLVFLIAYHFRRTGSPLLTARPEKGANWRRTTHQGIFSLAQATQA